MAHLATGLPALEPSLRSVTAFAYLPQLQTSRFKLTRIHDHTPEPMPTATFRSEMLDQATKALTDTVSSALITIMRDLKTHFVQHFSWLAKRKVACHRSRRRCRRTQPFHRWSTNPESIVCESEHISCYVCPAAYATSGRKRSNRCRRIRHCINGTSTKRRKSTSCCWGYPSANTSRPRSSSSRTSV